MKTIETLSRVGAFLILACFVVPGFALAQTTDSPDLGLTDVEKAVISEKPTIRYMDMQAYVLSQPETAQNIVKGLQISTSNIQTVSASDCLSQVGKNKGVVIVDAAYLHTLTESAVVDTIGEIIMTGVPVVFYGDAGDLLEKVGAAVPHSNWPVFKNKTMAGMIYWPTNQTVKAWSCTIEAESREIKDQLKVYQIADLFDWANGLMLSSNDGYGPMALASSSYYSYPVQRDSSEEYPYGKGNADVFCKKLVDESSGEVDWYVYENELSITPGCVLGWTVDWFNSKITNSDDIDYLSSHSSDKMYNYGPTGSQNGGTVSFTLGSGGASYTYSYPITNIRVVCACVPGDDYARWDHIWNNPSANLAAKQTCCVKPGWTVEVPQGEDTFVDERVELQFADYVFFIYSYHNIPDAWVSHSYGPGTP